MSQALCLVTYPNVGPEEIATIITDPVENALASIPDLERMTSQSEEGRNRVTLEFTRGTDISEAANDVRAALDRLHDDLPLEAEAPTIWKFDPNAISIVALSVASTRDLAATTRLLEREIAQRFEQIPGVGSITVSGGVYREIQVQLLRDRLRASGLSAADVAEALRRENVRLPGGNVQEGIIDLYIRTAGEYQSLDEIAATVVALRDGSPIRVRDVAEVVDGYQDVNNLAEVNGEPVVRLDIQKQSGANTVAVAARIRWRSHASMRNVTISPLRSTQIRARSSSSRSATSRTRQSGWVAGYRGSLRVSPQRCDDQHHCAGDSDIDHGRRLACCTSPG